MIPHTVPDEIVAPHRKLEAAVDLFVIAGLSFLAWIDLAMRVRMAPYMKDQEAQDVL